MLTFALRSLAAKRFRLISTALAIVLGVGFTVGTLVLSATLDRSLGDAIDHLSDGVDTMVQGVEAVDAGADASSERTPLPASLVDAVRAVDGVAAAAPSLDGYAQVIGASGKVLDVRQTRAVAWIDDPQLSMFELVEGRAPTRAGEVVLDDEAAQDAGAAIGGPVDIVTATGTTTLDLVGTARLDGGTSLGATAFVLLSGADADGLLNPPGTVDEVLARAEPGIDDAELTRRIAAALTGADVDVMSGTGFRADQKAEVGGITSLLQTILLVFAGIALFVGSFTIANAFTITVAQRTKELALVRAIGASRGQVVGVVLIEAALLGLVASAVGVAVGIGMAQGLVAVLGSLGLGLPEGALVIGVTPVVVGLALGVVITVVAALASARRAAQVAPVAAMQEGASEPAAASRLRIGSGALLGAGALAALAAGVAGSSASLVGLGAVTATVAALALGPVLVRPVMAVLGWPVRQAGVAGGLAARNAVRNPRRSASTAAALTIGVLLVMGASMFTATSKATLHDDIEATVVADRVVRPAGSSTGVPSALATALADVPGAAVLPMRDTMAAVGGAVERVTGVDLARAEGLLHLEVVEGALTGAPGTAAVSTDGAAAHGWAVGDRLDVQLSSGATSSVTVAGMFESATTLNAVLLPYGQVATAAAEPLDSLVLVSGPPAALDAVAAIVADAPTVEDVTVADHASAEAGTLDLLLNVVIAFLGLAVVIAVLGIGTTVALSVRERTAELGVLRSIGMSRRQLRRMVRLEAISIALLGTLTGTVLGLGSTWALLRTLADEGFAAPVFPAPALVATALGALLAGVLAAALPARRASRLAVLDAVRAQ